MVISIISSVILWGCAAVILLRTINYSGISLGGNKAMTFLLADKRRSIDESDSGWQTAVYVMLGALAFRLVVMVFSALTIAMWRDGELTFSNFINQYIQWDAHNYQRITDLTYGGYNENGDLTTLAFFPLYPWIARIFKLFIRDTEISLLLISILSYSVGCGFLYKLTELDYGKSVALKAVVFISVFPHSLFFGTMMNESMLFLNSVITLYFIRKHNWPLVGIFGALAALSRMVGILLAVPAAFEWLEYYGILGKLKEKRIKEVWQLFYSKGLWIFLMLAGIFIYLFCNYKYTGDWFKFLEYQEKYWGNGSEYFGKAIAGIADRAFTERSFIRAAIWIPELVSITLVTAMLVYGLRRSRLMYTAYLWIYIIINTGFEWPISIARYMVCAVPAFIFLAELSERHKWLEYFITAVMAVGLGVYLTAYLFSKQIL